MLPTFVGCKHAINIFLACRLITLFVMESFTFLSPWNLCISLALPLFLLFIAFRAFTRPKYKLPPGPRGWPLLGSLPSLEPLVYRSFAKMSRVYGPIMTVNLGTTPNIIICNTELAKDVLKNHDHVLASRPLPILAEHMFSAGECLAWAPLNSTWRNARKICTMELLNPSSLAAFGPIRREEVARAIQDLQAACKDMKPVRVRDFINAATINTMTRICFSKRYALDESGILDRQGQEFKDVVGESMRLGGAFNLADFIPFLRKLDLQGYDKLFRKFRQRMDALTEEILAEHRAKDQNQNDFLGTLLKLKGSYELSDTIIGNLVWEMVGAGSDTTAGAVEWTIAELLLNPEKMARAQAEIDGIVSKGEAVEEEHLPKLQYVNWCFKEAMRLHPPTSMLLPHRSIQACKIGGYDIPANTTVHINAWQINRDPTYWNDAEKYMPERYEKEDVDMRGFDFRLLPFGAGRRGCPGAQLAITTGMLLLANLLHKFELSLPPGIVAKEVDMMEAFGIVQCMNTPIKAVAKPRF